MAYPEYRRDSGDQNIFYAMLSEETRIALESYDETDGFSCSDISFEMTETEVVEASFGISECDFNKAFLAFDKCMRLGGRPNIPPPVKS